MDEDLPYEITIRRTINGYILTTYNCDWESEVKIKNEIVVEDREEFCEHGQVDVKSGQRMLLEVMEYFCLSGSKHDTRRLKLIIEES